MSTSIYLAANFLQKILRSSAILARSHLIDKRTDPFCGLDGPFHRSREFNRRRFPSEKHSIVERGISFSYRDVMDHYDFVKFVKEIDAKVRIAALEIGFFGPAHANDFFFGRESDLRIMCF